jgi:hypothetical protein
LAVSAVDVGIGSAPADIYRIPKENLSSFWCLQNHFFQIVFGDTLLSGKPYQNFNFISTPLLPENFGAVKRMTDLPGHFAGFQAKASSLGLYFKIDLLLAR